MFEFKTDTPSAAPLFALPTPAGVRAKPTGRASRPDFDFNSFVFPIFKTDFASLRYATTAPSGIVSVGSSEARAPPELALEAEATWFENKTDTPSAAPLDALPTPAGI